jgi:spermidine/putrescine transport system permease protein
MAASEEAPARTRGGQARARTFAPRYPPWLTTPSLTYYLLFFLAPLAILVVFSFARQPNTFAPGGTVVYALDPSQYHAVFDPLYVRIFGKTLLMAAGGTIMTVIVGYPIAYWMARYLARFKSLALLLVIVPFWTSFLIRTYAWLILLDPQGVVARFLHDTGVMDRLNWIGNWQAVGIGLVYNYLPLLILPVYASLERMDWTLVEAATDLGSSPLTAFRQITLPLTLPGLITGALLVFIPMTGEYVIPSILGQGRFEFVGNVVADQFSGSNWPLGSAMSIALMLVLSLFVIIYIAFATREEQFGA